MLEIEVGQQQVYFEHHVLLWKHPSIGVESRPMKGAFKRMLAGLPVFMTQTTGTGRVAFSRDGVGEVFALHLDAGQALDCREHQFLAATASIDFTFQRVKGVANILLGGNGFFIDTFSALHPASSGCTATATSSSSRSRRANRSTSSRAAGSTRTARSRCRR